MRELAAWFLRTLNPQQICIVCLMVTLGGAMYASKSFAGSDEFSAYVQSDLEDKLIELRIKQCKADTDQARQFFYERLNRKQQQYEQLTGHRFSVPECSDL